MLQRVRFLKWLKREGFPRKDSTFIKLKCNYHSGSTLDNEVVTQSSRLISRSKFFDSTMTKKKKEKLEKSDSKTHGILTITTSLSVKIWNRGVCNLLGCLQTQTEKRQCTLQNKIVQIQCLVALFPDPIFAFTHRTTKREY